MIIRRADVEPTPDVFAAVMATGILSIAAHNHGSPWISDTLGAGAGLSFLGRRLLPPRNRDAGRS